MQPINHISGRAIPLGRANVDTDVIIPAHYLKTITREGLGQGAFETIRAEPGNVFDAPENARAPILIAGDNFGCGSSREHAAWALLDLGISCVIAPSFSDIFSGNAFKNGILAVALPQAVIDRLMVVAQTDPIDVDLEHQTVTTKFQDRFSFAIDPFRKACLLGGLDEIGLTLSSDAAIGAHEGKMAGELPFLSRAASIAMKALLSEVSGGPETLVLSQVPAPTPGPGQLLIAVKACAINYPDTLIIEDRYQLKPPRPFSPGGEVSGVIAGIGAEVEGWAVGDRVMALTTYGGLAEFVAVDARKCFALPADVSFETGAALLFTYGTSLHALADRGNLAAGETLLVLGAAGGVGIAAVELGKAMGARVIAGVSSEAKADAARQAGADAAIIYPEAPFDKDTARAFTDMVKTACGGVDVAYDAVGGDYTQGLLRSMAWGGRLLIVGFPAGIAQLPANLALLKGCDICGVFWGAWAERNPVGLKADVAELLALLASGKIAPRISQMLPLARAGEGIAALAGRTAIGKVVVQIAS